MITKKFLSYYGMHPYTEELQCIILDHFIDEDENIPVEELDGLSDNMNNILYAVFPDKSSSSSSSSQEEEDDEEEDYPQGLEDLISNDNKSDKLEFKRINHPELVSEFKHAFNAILDIPDDYDYECADMGILTEFVYGHVLNTRGTYNYRNSVADYITINPDNNTLAEYMCNVGEDKTKQFLESLVTDGMIKSLFGDNIPDVYKKDRNVKEEIARAFVGFVDMDEFVPKLSKFVASYNPKYVKEIHKVPDSLQFIYNGDNCSILVVLYAIKKLSESEVASDYFAKCYDACNSYMRAALPDLEDIKYDDKLLAILKLFQLEDIVITDRNKINSTVKYTVEVKGQITCYVMK
jgi:hypothetical protein